MTALATRHFEITPEEMLEIPEAKHAELVDGELLEKPSMSLQSGGVTGLLVGELIIYNKQHRLGVVSDSQTSYQCFPHAPRQVRKPDLSFIRRERLTPQMRRGHLKIVPDFVAEVVSPHDLASDIEGRISDFLRAGTPLVWVLYPDLKVAVVYKGGGGGGAGDAAAGRGGAERGRGTAGVSRVAG